MEIAFGHEIFIDQLTRNQKFIISFSTISSQATWRPTYIWLFRQFDVEHAYLWQA